MKRKASASIRLAKTWWTVQESAQERTRKKPVKTTEIVTSASSVLKRHAKKSPKLAQFVTQTLIVLSDRFATMVNARDSDL